MTQAEHKAAPRNPMVLVTGVLALVAVVLCVIILTRLRSLTVGIEQNSATLEWLQTSLERLDAHIVPDQYFLIAAIDSAQDNWNEEDLVGAKDALMAGVNISPSDPRVFTAIMTMAREAHDHIASIDAPDQAAELASFRDKLMRMADASISHLPLEEIKAARITLTALEERVMEAGGHVPGE